LLKLDTKEMVIVLSSGVNFVEANWQK